MTKSKIPAVTLLSLLALTVGSRALSAQDKGEADQKPAMCAVVQVGDELRIVPKDEVDALKKKLEAEHKEAVEAYKQAKAEAKKNKEKFTDPAPKPVKLKVVKASIEEDKAEALVEKMKADMEKKGRKGGKGEKPKKDKPKKDKASGG